MKNGVSFFLHLEFVLKPLSKQNQIFIYYNRIEIFKENSNKKSINSEKKDALVKEKEKSKVILYKNMRIINLVNIKTIFN